MLIQGINDKKRTNILIQNYIKLLKKAENPSFIRVIVLNSFKKVQFIKELKKQLPDINEKEIKIQTFSGLCYSSFLDNWDYISGLTNNTEPDVMPNLCGLEVSQYIFKQCIKESDFKDYISKVNLLHQLFRRYSLTVQNDLTNKEITERSKILKESFYKEAQAAIDGYKLKTISLKSYDYLRQLAILPVICKNTDYFKNTEYLIADDADEQTYAFWLFIDNIMPYLKDYYIAYDKNGSSRIGYLCAYKSGIEEFKKKYNPKEIIITPEQPFYQLAENFYNEIKSGKKIKIDGYNSVFKSKSSILRLEMIDNVIKDIKLLIKDGVNPADISIITPFADKILTNTINEKLTDISIQVLSGSEKLAEVNCIKYILTLLKVLNEIEVSREEVRNILYNLLKIPLTKCFMFKNIFINHDFGNKEYNSKYTKLISTIKSVKKNKSSVSGQIQAIYENILKSEITKEEKDNIDFLIKEAKSFETAFKGSETIVKDFILQTENSIISENSAEASEISENSLIISTPQKIIDFSIERKYQFWLDITSAEWAKEDTGTLYNAWVFNRDWKKKEFKLADNIENTREKTARIIRKLILCAHKGIRIYSSLYDNNGNENFSGFNNYIEYETNTNKSDFRIIPREDQKSVLEYKSGKFGIMAVPGAGKTTILLALIIKLLETGVKGENIFVLTYMESAAKNFKERIKFILPQAIDIPNISTIHGLALRIIKENANYVKAGLDENFEICDDNLKEKIIKEIFIKNNTDEENYDNYLKCISYVKLSRRSDGIHSRYREIQNFFNFYKEYNNKLKENNLIDYDDMLYYAVKILEENEDILKYYQGICKYIIEDEAQDSTEIQQKLISLLSGKSGNIVRCGDINQSITSTFTNSDTGSFEEFIKSNAKAEMTSSQRCAKPIYELANRLIKGTCKEDKNQTAFYEIEIKGTDKNPKEGKSPSYNIFETERNEKEFILNKIKEIIKEDSTAKIGILLRLNTQVTEYNEYLALNGIRSNIRTDYLSQKRIFKYIYQVLKIVSNPLNNEYINELSEIYSAEGKLSLSEREYIKSLNKEFININPDEIEQEGISQFYWDIIYWINSSCESPERLAYKAGLFYSNTDTDRTNTYIISTIIQKLREITKDEEELTEKIKYMSNKPAGGYRLFEDEAINQEQVNIMTTHKSKGDEFDYVFLAEMNENNYPLRDENVKLKAGSHFVQTIKSLTDETKIKTPEDLKREQTDETLRLLYVGITRAKKELYFTTAKTYKKMKRVKISDFLTNLM